MELRITFSHSRKNLMKVNGQDLECVKHAKILGLLRYLAILRGITT